MSTQGEQIKALVVHQWLPEWEQIRFDPASHQSEPLKEFLMFTMPARTLRKLSNTYRRSTEGLVPRVEDTGIQREHDPDRSQEIARFVRDGYPLSGMSQRKRALAGPDMRKPGWLPTAIVVNILDPANPQAGRKVAHSDSLRVPDPSSWRRGDVVSIGLPQSWGNEEAWTPQDAFPVEVIDGQHRLWSFLDDDDDSEFDLPVVAFFGLDISWQAYLFWTINIKPKKINASLAYDLYPLLRDQEWLREGEGIDVYRETRSQELTEALWSFPTSPWHKRINMLGSTGVRRTQPVTQAAFVRSISEALVRPWESRTSGIGGLFGGASSGAGLGWSRAQQAAFLLAAWSELAAAVAQSGAEWAESLRGDPLEFPLTGPEIQDDAFSGQYSLLASDQGVRAFHQALNDFFYAGHREFELSMWRSDLAPDDVSDDAIRHELASIQRLAAGDMLRRIAVDLATYDWRNSKFPHLSREQTRDKQALRGTGGYKLLREALIATLTNSSDEVISRVARDAQTARR